MPNSDEVDESAVHVDASTHWFEAAADHLGDAYLRYSFTKGTEQEVDFLIGALGLEPPMRVLDVGCGPGRHALSFAARGFRVTGVDVSQRFIEIGRERAESAGLAVTFLRRDARNLGISEEFDVAVSLCQGAFGLQGATSMTPVWTAVDQDAVVLDAIGRSLAPGGRCAFSAFSAYFQVRWLCDTDSFNAANGVNHEQTELRDPCGTVIPASLWTTCFTPRELSLLAARAGLDVDAIWSVEPGRYAEVAPTIESPEFLVVATKR